MRCWPGAVCRIDRAGPGRKANIGAFVTVLRAIPLEVTCGAEVWEFTDASRPLLIRSAETGRVDKQVRASAEIADYWVYLNDAHLTPITPPPGTVIDKAAEPMERTVVEKLSDKMAATGWTVRAPAHA